jgi:hypothetical protein
VFILFYYLYWILGAIFSYGSNPCYAQKKTKNLEHLNPNNKDKKGKSLRRNPDTWSFLAFDKDMFSFEDYSFSNYLEILSYLGIILSLTFFSNLHATSTVLIFLMITVQFVVYMVNHG